MTTLTLPLPAIAASRPRPGLVATLAFWAERHRQRQALLTLDAGRLADIGISAAEAWREGRKPFWRD